MKTIKPYRPCFTITPPPQKTSTSPYKPWMLYKLWLKEEEHFWHYHNQILCDLWQLPGEGIHALNTHITTLINNSKFTCTQTKETPKIMPLQHAVKYHEAHNWICLQDQEMLTYQFLLAHCKLTRIPLWTLLKKQEKGHGELSTLSAASSTCSSIHQDAKTTHIKCSCCGYSHARASCPAYGKECYNCHSTGHVLPHARNPTITEIPRKDIPDHPERAAQSVRSSSCRCSSRLASRSRQSCHSMNHSPFINCLYTCRFLLHPGRRRSIPYIHQVSHFSVI